MTNVRRSLIIESELRVECAVRADGSSPARLFLDQLKEGMWTDPSVAALPDPEQISDYNRFLNLMRDLARDQAPTRQGDIKYLGYGLWEFRVYTKRLVFYDTPGDGSYSVKAPIRNREMSPFPEEDTWWFPEMDRVIRLANCWPKVGQKADSKDIQLARAIREEDLAHDV